MNTNVYAIRMLLLVGVSCEKKTARRHTRWRYYILTWSRSLIANTFKIWNKTRPEQSRANQSKAKRWAQQNVFNWMSAWANAHFVSPPNQYKSNEMESSFSEKNPSERDRKGPKERKRARSLRKRTRDRMFMMECAKISSKKLRCFHRVIKTKIYVINSYNTRNNKSSCTIHGCSTPPK